VELLSCAVWLSIGAASDTGFFRVLDRRMAAFLDCEGASAAVVAARRGDARFVAFGAEASATLFERAGLAAADTVLPALVARDDEAALRGAGAARPRADLAFSFWRVAFSLSLRAVSFSRIAASAALATCDRPASAVESKASKKALITLLVPRGADASDFAIELCSPASTAITLICQDRTNLRRAAAFLLVSLSRSSCLDQSIDSEDGAAPVSPTRKCDSQPRPLHQLSPALT
jgi:hypothetical protein